LLYLFDEFELNEEEFSLSRRGRRIAIEPRALRVLFVLVSSSGKLLDKRVLLDAVWKDTFVEDTTLTRTIAVIRKHLEDDPRDPKYVETIPTRGYRFIASVVTRQPVEAEKSATEFPGPALPMDTPSASDEPPPEVASVTSAVSGNAINPTSKRRAWLWAAGVLFFVGIGGGLFLRYRSHRTTTLSTKDTIVLADFTNTSGDPVFDGTLRQGMMVQLEQSPVLRLASEGQIRKTLKLMGLQPDVSLTSEVSREVCQRISGDVVLDGSISHLGNEYVLGLRARRCGTGDELDAEQVQIARKEDALNALSEIATRFRTRIGETSATIRDLDTPLAEATTSSLDALKAFSQATRTFNIKGSRAAMPLFLHATELDPQFAMAHVWLGRMYADLGEEASSIKSTQSAYTLRDRASDRERFSIDVSYDLLVSGNLEKARVTCDAWVLMYPRDVYPRTFLSGMIYPAYGQYERALEEAKSSIAIDPDFVVGYRNAALDLIALNRLDEAEKVLGQAAQRKLFLPSFVTDSYRMAFLKGDRKGMKRAVDAAPTNPWLLNYEAATLAQAGQLIQARELQDQAVHQTLRGSRQELEAQLLVTASFTEVFYGYPDDAAKQVRTALRLSTGRNVEYAAALVLAMTANADEASKLVNDLRQRFPDDALVRYNYLPTIRAALALADKQPQQAVDLLRETSQFELSQPLYPIYLRGLAFLAMGQASQGAAEFKKIVDHPGLVLNDPLLNLAQINLARADVAKGDKDDAKAAYDLVLRRWNSADAGLRIMQQVKKERAKLN
jgi:DNA-binding winged helix-turn-helix (wHTH) protein/tetratricopeptide (TPR) repeat protein